MLNGTMRPEDVHMGFGGAGINPAAGASAAPSAGDTPAPNEEEEDEEMPLPGMEIWVGGCTEAMHVERREAVYISNSTWYP